MGCHSEKTRCPFIGQSFRRDVGDVKAAAILTNPPIRAGKETVFRFYDGAFEKLISGGEFWVVIQKKQGAPSSVSHLEEMFSEVDVVEKKKGYWIIRAKK